MSAGGAHTCSLFASGAVKCWGDNVSGQLDLGDQADRGDQVGLMGDSLPAIQLGTGVVPLLRPDALIRVDGSSFLGNGIYNNTGTRQTVDATVGRTGHAAFTVKFQNDGNQRDDFIVRGSGTTAKFSAKYLDGSTNVTTGVTAGTVRFDDVVGVGVRRV